MIRAQRVLYPWRSRPHGRLDDGRIGQSGYAYVLGTDKDAPGVSTTGWFYGNFHQLVLQAEAAAFIIVVNVILTYTILKIISLIVPLRMDEKTLTIGDEAVHGEEAYAMD
jgi:ammonia channel protein AmtB